MEILIPVMKKGMNKGAWRGAFKCQALKPDGTICNAEKWKFVEQIGPYRIRYRCGGCGKTAQYDYSGNPDHPYAVFGKSKFQRIVDAWRNRGQAPRDGLITPS